MKLVYFDMAGGSFAGFYIEAKYFVDERGRCAFKLIPTIFERKIQTKKPNIIHHFTVSLSCYPIETAWLPLLTPVRLFLAQMLK